MKVAALLLSVAAACPCGAWPADFAYRGKVRPDSWWDKVYLHFRGQIASVDGAYVDAGAVKEWHTQLDVGVAGKIAGKVLKLTDGKQCFARLLQFKKGLDSAYQSQPGIESPNGQIVYIELRELPSKSSTFTGLYAAVGSFASESGKKYVRCVPYAPKPDSDSGISQDEFVDAINAGLVLAEWRWRKVGINKRTGTYHYMEWYRRFVQ